MALGWIAKQILETNKSDKWFRGDSMKVSALFFPPAIINHIRRWCHSPIHSPHQSAAVPHQWHLILFQPNKNILTLIGCILMASKTSTTTLSSPLPPHVWIHSKKKKSFSVFWCHSPDPYQLQTWLLYFTCELMWASQGISRMDTALEPGNNSIMIIVLLKMSLWYRDLSSCRFFWQWHVEMCHVSVL